MTPAIPPGGTRRQRPMGGRADGPDPPRSAVLPGGSVLLAGAGPHDLGVPGPAAGLISVGAAGQGAGADRCFGNVLIRFLDEALFAALAWIGMSERSVG